MTVATFKWSVLLLSLAVAFPVSATNKKEENICSRLAQRLSTLEKNVQETKATLDEKTRVYKEQKGLLARSYCVVNTIRERLNTIMGRLLNSNPYPYPYQLARLIESLHTLLDRQVENKQGVGAFILLGRALAGSQAFQAMENDMIAVLREIRSARIQLQRDSNLQKQFQLLETALNRLIANILSTRETYAITLQVNAQKNYSRLRVNATQRENNVQLEHDEAFKDLGEQAKARVQTTDDDLEMIKQEHRDFLAKKEEIKGSGETSTPKNKGDRKNDDDDTAAPDGGSGNPTHIYPTDSDPDVKENPPSEGPHDSLPAGSEDIITADMLAEESEKLKNALVVAQSQQNFVILQEAKDALTAVLENKPTAASSHDSYLADLRQKIGHIKEKLVVALELQRMQRALATLWGNKPTVSPPPTLPPVPHLKSDPRLQIHFKHGKEL